MARGLGAFADGLTDGIVTRQRLERDRQAAENEKKRMALEESRFALDKARSERDAEQFGLTKQLTLQQIEAGGLDLDQRKRDRDFQASQSKRLSELVAASQGGVELDVIDPSGKQVGPMRFSSMEQATRDLQQKGLTFRPGSAKQIAALNPVDLEMRAADIMLEEALRYGKVTPELLKEAKNRRKEAEREGAIEALRYYHTTGDEAGAKAMFNKNGKIKIGDDVKLELKPGMFGPTVAGFRIGKDGKKQEVFDGFRDVILPSMSSEAYANTMAAFKQTEIKEQGDTARNAASNANARGIALLNNQGAMDRELVQNERAGRGQKDPMFVELETIIMDPARAAMGNPSNAMNIEQYQQDTMNVMNTAYALYKSGKAKSAPEAAAMAMQIVRQAKQNAQQKPK
jgi:hypothetical protein